MEGLIVLEARLDGKKLACVNFDNREVVTCYHVWNSVRSIILKFLL